ncbi:unnamed protein product [[Candida] boidinii]|nr:unnamed protein product [[Candida] boidinii]
MDNSPPRQSVTTSSSKKTSLPPRKRSKVSRACDECRRKKIRCDAILNNENSSVLKICTNCTKNGDTCTFTRIPLKRGPIKGYVRSNDEQPNSNNTNNTNSDYESSATSLSTSSKLIFQQLPQPLQPPQLNTSNSSSTTSPPSSSSDKSLGLLHSIQQSQQSQQSQQPQQSQQSQQQKDSKLPFIPQLNDIHYQQNSNIRSPPTTNTNIPTNSKTSVSSPPILLPPLSSINSLPLPNISSASTASVATITSPQTASGAMTTNNNNNIGSPKMSSPSPLTNNDSKLPQPSTTSTNQRQNFLSIGLPPLNMLNNNGVSTNNNNNINNSSQSSANNPADNTKVFKFLNPLQSSNSSSPSSPNATPGFSPFPGSSTYLPGPGSISGAGGTGNISGPPSVTGSLPFPVSRDSRSSSIGTLSNLAPNNNNNNGGGSSIGNSSGSGQQFQGLFWKVPYDLPPFESRRDSIDSVSSSVISSSFSPRLSTSISMNKFNNNSLTNNSLTNNSISSLTHNNNLPANLITAPNNNNNSSALNSPRPSVSSAYDSAESDSEDEFLNRTRSSRANISIPLTSNTKNTNDNTNNNNNTNNNESKSPPRMVSSSPVPSISSLASLNSNMAKLNLPLIPSITTTGSQQNQQKLYNLMRNIENNLHIYYNKFNNSFTILPLEKEIIIQSILKIINIEEYLTVIEFFNNSILILNSCDSPHFNFNDIIQLFLQVTNIYSNKNFINKDENLKLIFSCSLVILNYSVLLTGNNYSLGLSITFSIFNDWKMFRDLNGSLNENKFQILDNDPQGNGLKINFIRILISFLILDNLYSLSFGTPKFSSISNSFNESTNFEDFIIKCYPNINSKVSYEKSIYNFTLGLILISYNNSKLNNYLLINKSNESNNNPNSIVFKKFNWNLLNSNFNFSKFLTILKEIDDLINFFNDLNNHYQNLSKKLNDSSDNNDNNMNDSFNSNFEEEEDFIFEFQLKFSKIAKTLTNAIQSLMNDSNLINLNNSSDSSNHIFRLSPFIILVVIKTIKTVYLLLSLLRSLIELNEIINFNDLKTRLPKLENELSIIESTFLNSFKYPVYSMPILLKDLTDRIRNCDESSIYSNLFKQEQHEQQQQQQQQLPQLQPFNGLSLLISASKNTSSGTNTLSSGGSSPRNSMDSKDIKFKLREITLWVNKTNKQIENFSYEEFYNGWIL